MNHANTVNKLYDELERVSSNMVALQTVIKLGVSEKTKDELTARYNALHDKLVQINRRLDIEVAKSPWEK